MTRCIAIRKNGQQCKLTSKTSEYCHWHRPNNEECAVCFGSFKSYEQPLPCNHWVHYNCVQKSADAMQDLRAAEGCPLLEECECPICRQPVEGMRPKVPQVPQVTDQHIHINLGESDGSFAFDPNYISDLIERSILDWHSANIIGPLPVPLQLFVWMNLSRDIIVTTREAEDTLFRLSEIIANSITDDFESVDNEEIDQQSQT